MHNDHFFQSASNCARMQSSGPIKVKGMSQIKWDPGSDKIGAGNFGDVFPGTVMAPGEPEVAVKVLKKIPENRDQQVQFLREAEISSKLKFSSILNAVTWSAGCERWLIVTERARKSLDDMIKSQASGVPESWTDKNGTQVTWDSTKKMICIVGVAYGLAYLHKCKIIHRDLKPANILLDENMYPHVSDFGLSRMLPDTKESITKFYTMTGATGTPLYMAPEVMSGERYNAKADVFSFGMLVYELVTDQAPWQGRRFNFHQLYSAVTASERPEIPSYVPDSMRNLIVSCWDPNPSARPSMEEICSKLSSQMLDPGEEEFNCDEVDDYIQAIREEYRTVRVPRFLV